MKNAKQILIYSLISLVTAFLLLMTWIYQLNKEIQERIQGGWFKPPVELYTGGQRLRVGQSLSSVQWLGYLADRRYRERYEGQSLHANDYTHLSADQCREILRESFADDIQDCVYLRTPENNTAPSQTMLIVFNPENKITRLMVAKSQTESGRQLVEQEEFFLAPQLFAQYYGGEPILRDVLKIGDVPITCLHAAMAIEDSHFLEHSGVSVRGLFRATIRNLLEGRYAQGGSTITQQLVKNYFLTSERTLKRKFVELFMSILLEANVDKDEILENYLNVTYMGQNGPFQVVGFAAAAKHYFKTPLPDLNLSQCALLAAIINSPGRYNPFAHPENAAKRRSLVLDRMTELNLIDKNSADLAKTESLPKKREADLTEPAPYYTQAIFRELRTLNIDTENQGLKIYTALDPTAQEAAQTEVLKHVEWLEKENKSVAKLKSQGKNLEAALISIDIATGDVIALVGGRQFRKTQYNHILDAHRQVGSVMKPLVYLTALESKDRDGEFYNPMTIVEDIPFVHSYEGQKWSPKNYTKEHYGKIPLYFALKSSLNISTAKLGLDIGLSNVIDVARRAGIESGLQPFPSLSLGAFEIYPKEVAQAYLTVARFGSRIPLSYIRSVQTLEGKEIHRDQREAAVEFKPQKVAVLVGMMKETFRSGTARIAKLWGFDRPAAGKTGTTSDTKDAWFVGFTPHILTVTWVGYGDNTPSGLTGASGALPLWVKYMNPVLQKYPNSDFNWPDGITKKSYSKNELIPLIEKYEDADVVDTEFIFED